MKHKKFIIFLLAIFSVFLIYKFNYVPKLNYLALGDDLALGKTPFNEINSSYADYFYDYLNQNYEVNSNFKKTTEEDYRVTDLIKDITSGSVVEDNQTITQLIKEANIITVSIGSEELFSKLYQNKEIIINGKTDNILEFIDELFIDIELLVYKLKELTNVPIIFVGYYNIFEYEEENFSQIFNYIDNKFNKIASENISYVSIYEGFKFKSYYLPNINSNFPSLEGYNFISNKIIEIVESNNLI